jgi:hypothetical protein
MPRLLPAVAVLAVFLFGSALGGSASAQSLRTGPLVERWGGASWTQVAVPSGSNDDAWAVGGRSGGGYVMHWNGSAWAGKTKLDQSRELVAVAEISATEA